MRLVLMLAFMVVSNLPDPKERQQVQSANTNEPGQRHKKSAASSTQLNQTLPNSQPQLTQQSEDRAAKANLDRQLAEATVRLASFTAGLFLATVALAGGTLLLGGLGFLQWRDAQHSLRIAEGTSAATVKAANAARDSADSATMHAHRQLRAYIRVHPLASPRQVVGEVPRLTFSVTNFGQTPSRKVVTAGGIRIIPFPTPVNTGWSDTVPTGDPAAMLSCYPGSGGGIKDVVLGDTVLTNQDLTDITAGTKRLHTYGRVDYEDVFGDAHYTEFCFIFGGDTSKNAYTYLYAGKNNDAT